MAVHLNSSQDFIRALKASSDTGTPSKIQIASQAWNESTFYVPNKDQVIVDWILTRLLKEKSKELSVPSFFYYAECSIFFGRAFNPVADTDHWLLLAEIISPLKQTDDSRRLKTWLVPLLNRTPLIPIVVAYLNLLPSLTSSQREALSEPFVRCFVVLWPLATQKVNADTLLECFGAFLDAFGVGSKELATVEVLAVIGPVITSSYRSALSNSANKKKVSFSADLCFSH